MKSAPVAMLLFVASTLLVAQGQGPQHSAVVIPDSSVEHPQDIGIRAHTNHLIRVRPELGSSSPTGETPSSIAAVYNLPNPSHNPAPAWTWNGSTIVIVDAYDNPTAENDLNVFSSQFGLPTCTSSNGCFTKIYAAGSKPRSNCGWAQESALDIQWAHAMSPMAKIVLVEAASNSFSNLLSAVDKGTNYILSTAGGGKGQLSMSWGGSEFSGETSSDFHFLHNGVVYFGASGDTGGTTIWPSASPNVVAAGGTTINRDSSGNFVSETGWSGSGGGPSKYESKPSYQVGVANTDPNQRSIPDFSFDSNPNSGVSVYDSTSCQGFSGWLVFGGTSVASPSLSGIVNQAGHVSSSSNSSTELSTIYSGFSASYGTNFRDITTGSAGSFSAGSNWDFVTGVGSNLGLNGK